MARKTHHSSKAKVLRIDVLRKPQPPRQDVAKPMSLARALGEPTYLRRAVARSQRLAA